MNAVRQQETKLFFVQDFMKTEDEDIIQHVIDFYNVEECKTIHDSIQPMSVQELNRRVYKRRMTIV